MATTAHTIGCVNEATRILGDKWTPRLLRSIANDGAARFCQLQDGVGGINPRTLTARLAGLESEGIIERCPAADTRRECYRLSQKGEALLPILDLMAGWGERFGGDSADNSL